MRQYRINQVNDEYVVECRKDDQSEWYECARIDEKATIIFDGELPGKMCDEVYTFLETQGIYIDEDGIAWALTN